MDKIFNLRHTQFSLIYSSRTALNTLQNKEQNQRYASPVQKLIRGKFRYPQKIVNLMGKPVSLETRIMIQAYKEIEFKPEKTYEILTKNHPSECPSIRTIYNLYKLHDKQGSMQTSLIGKVGRKPILSEQQEQKLVKSVKKNPELSLRKIVTDSKQEQYQQICYKTVSNILAKNNLFAFRKQSRIILSEKQRLERYNFVRTVQRWTNNLKKVYFSDECILKRGKIGNKFYGKRKEIKLQTVTALKRQNIVQPALHVFGLIGYDGVKQLVQVNGKLNSEKYIEIIDNCFKEIGKEQMSERIFMQDRASCHYSKKTIKWLNDNEIDHLKWPPKGADLNPLECVWSILKEEIIKLDCGFKNQDEMFHAATKIFQNNERIDRTIRNTIQSLPKRVQQILKTGGDFYYK